MLESLLTNLSSENYARQFLEENDVRVILQRLARLTQEEARMTAGLILEVIYGLVNNMTVIMEGKYTSSPFDLLHTHR